MEHQHLIIRAEVLNPPTDNKFIEDWLIDLVGQLGMKVAAGPISSYVTKKGNRGITAAILIETSHIVIHVWDEKNPSLIQLDVYTCSNLDVERTIDHLGIFNPVKVEYKFLNRNTELIVIDEGGTHGSNRTEERLDNNGIQRNTIQFSKNTRRRMVHQMESSNKES